MFYHGLCTKQHQMAFVTIRIWSTQLWKVAFLLTLLVDFCNFTCITTDVWNWFVHWRISTRPYAFVWFLEVRNPTGKKVRSRNISKQVTQPLSYLQGKGFWSINWSYWNSDGCGIQLGQIDVQNEHFAGAFHSHGHDHEFGIIHMLGLLFRHHIFPWKRHFRRWPI